MATSTWQEEDDGFKERLEVMKEAFRTKPRFSFKEVKVLLHAVKRNRYILLKKFNQGVSAENKKQAWQEITEQINGLGENHRQVRQIMKKWADLKCDGKRRIAALRGPNGRNLRKKKLGPVEKMVHKILMLSPRGDGESDPDLEEPEFSKHYRKDLTAAPYSYLGGSSSPPPTGEMSYDMSPLSSPEKEVGEHLHSSSDFDLADDAELNMDFDENDNSVFSSFSFSSSLQTSAQPDPDDALPKIKPVHTYSRSIQNQPQNQSQNSTKPLPGPSASSSGPPPAPLSSSASANGGVSKPPNTSDPLPARPAMAQIASQSLQQQQHTRVLLTSVSRSLETLAQSIQLLAEAQQEFVQQSLLLQRETVDVLKDFSNTTLHMLREKPAGGAPGSQTLPQFHQNPSAQF